MKKCPSYAIDVDKTEKTWRLDRIKCISCGSCTDWCPKKCLHLQNAYTESNSVRETFVESHKGA
ncbi:MAG: hypothetical protein A2Y33_13970 [Spirochaetes bacterium GWF1_51_8]|nr:MAG: hypothetical protein A2Y33_13970 [Spirochaetes bacterium GWF1_51_8]